MHEACGNSRPLCPLTDDPSDCNFLTPSHFLTGSTQVALPEPELINIPDNRLTRYQQIQKQVHQYWKYWSRDFLHTLQPRHKWNNKRSNLDVGAIVLLKEDNLPPCSWLLGRIIEVYSGSDGFVRTVKVKTNKGVFKRPVVKCCVLPIQDNEKFF